MMSYYFISGMHRSGSSLLSAILSQNPRFYSGPASPVLNLMYETEKFMQEYELFQAYPKPRQSHQILSSQIYQYYSDIDKPVIFDKNRSWPLYINYIENYIGQSAKIICTMRGMKEVLLSFLKIIHKNFDGIKFNPYDEQVILNQMDLTDTNRCNMILRNHSNVVESIENVRWAFNNGLGDRLLLIDYNKLVSEPESSLRDVYDFLGEQYYPHDFINIENNNIIDDGIYNLTGLHDVRQRVEKEISTIPVQLTPEQISRCDELDSLWRNL